MASHWYVIHTYAGFEGRVRTGIVERAHQLGMAESVGQVLVPTEDVVEFKDGKRRASKRKFFPGYILVKMELNDQSWHFIRNIPKVIGFVGGKLRDGKIDPNSVPNVEEIEVKKIKTQIEEGTLKPKPKIAFEKGKFRRYSS